MSFRRLLTQTVTVKTHTPGVVDEYNNPTDSFSAGTAYPARLEQSTGRENTADRDTQVGDYLLILPPEATVNGSDRVVADGSTFEVIGPPVVQRTPRGAHHVEARLQLVKG